MAAAGNNVQYIKKAYALRDPIFKLTRLRSKVSIGLNDNPHPYL